MDGDRFPLYQKPVSIVSAPIMLPQSTSPSHFLFPASRVAEPNVDDFGTVILRRRGRDGLRF